MYTELIGTDIIFSHVRSGLPLLLPMWDNSYVQDWVVPLLDNSRLAKSVTHRFPCETSVTNTDKQHMYIQDKVHEAGYYCEITSRDNLGARLYSYGKWSWIVDQFFLSWEVFQYFQKITTI